jgi:hypothetical protein
VCGERRDQVWEADATDRIATGSRRMPPTPEASSSTGAIDTGGRFVSIHSTRRSIPARAT